MGSSRHSLLRFRVLDQSIQLRVEGTDDALARRLSTDFSAFPRATSKASISIDVAATKRGWVVNAPQQPPRAVRGKIRLRWALDKALTIALQKTRPDLFFVHAAVIAKAGCAIILVGKPGAGKSTTCWALTERGWQYASDELAPFERTGDVWPYPRSLWFKTPPPPPYRIPQSVDRAGTGLFTLAATDLHALDASRPYPVAAIFFLDERFDGGALRPVRPSVATALLYSHTLNALAHDHAGLRRAATLCTALPCYGVGSAALSQVCDAIEQTMQPSFAPAIRNPKMSGS